MSAGHRVELFDGDRRARRVLSRSRLVSRSTSSSPSACSGRRMNETSFYVEGEAAEKLAVLYMPDLFSRRATRATRAGQAALSVRGVPLGRKRAWCSTAAGLPPVSPRCSLSVAANSTASGPRRAHRRVHDAQPPARWRGHSRVHPRRREGERSLGSASGSAFSVVTDPPWLRG